MRKLKKKTAKPRKASTELARVPKPRVTALEIHDPHQLLPQVGALGDEAAVGVLGQVEVTLTKAEEDVLSEAVNPADVQIKPNGVPYLSHPTYTTWFNRAFGRLGWAIVPLSKPRIAENLVVVPYLLYIHGRPAAHAMGEQEYHPSNRQQSYGDAVEATVASALRRCAKRLGVGLELWNKQWLQAWMATHAVSEGGKWRLRQGGIGETWTELRAKADAQVAEWQAPPPGDESRRTPRAAGDIITTEQRQRLGRLVKQTGRNEAEIRLWLKKRYNVTSEQILKKDYNAICDQLAVRGALPLPGDGEG